MATRVQQNKRVFVIGAGMSAECGAPVTKEFLKPKFTDLIKGKKIKLVKDFIKSVYKNKKDPNIEMVWTRIDDAIVSGEILERYDSRKLLEVRDALLHVLTRILSSEHNKLMETLEWCGVGLDFGPPNREEVESLKVFLEKPIKWGKLLLRGLPPNYVYTAKFIELMVSHDNVQSLTDALTIFLSKRQGHPLDYARNSATRLANVLFNRIKFHPIGERDLFLYRLGGLREDKIFGTRLLGSHDDKSGKIIEEILWKIYLLRNQKERLDNLKGWLDTYYFLIQVLRKGDTIITTNYDLFLEIALLWWEKRETKYGVLWGTDMTEIRNEFHSSYIPGTAVNYAKWEISAEGYTEYAYQRMINAEKDNAVEKLNAEHRKRYEECLKSWQMKKKENKWVSVLKLHGSINWGICRTCKDLYSGRLIPFYQAKATILKHRKNSKAYKTHLLCCHNPIFDPLMVPPTWRKDYDNRVLVNIWSEAEQRLSHADSLVILGYSMPKLDKRIRDLFNKALYDRSGRPWDEVLIVNRNVKNVLPNYNEVFDNLKPIQCNASSYLQQITKKQKHK
jgi:NAD-dependent SIR2 family protein deacetylase